MRAYYEHRLRVAFEDTNLVGNVYYVNHVRWQGRCRELFLREHAPQVVAELAHGLSLATTRVSCEYYQDLRVFDEVAVRMRVGAVTTSRLSMQFEYWRVGAHGDEELVARGEQEVVFLRPRDGRLQPAPLPEPLRTALAPFLGESFAAGATGRSGATPTAPAEALP